MRDLACLNFETACAAVNMLEIRHTAHCTSSSVMESREAPRSEKLGTGSAPFLVIHGCSRTALAVIRLDSSLTNIFFKRSTHSGVRRESNSGSSFTMEANRSKMAGLSKGKRPMRKQYSVTPQAQTSSVYPCEEAFPTLHSCGLMKAGVPTEFETMSSPGFTNISETPKSAILHSPLACVSKILSGLISL